MNTTPMTDSEINVKLAEALGWEWFHPEDSYSEGEAVGYWQRGAITSAGYERSNWIEESQRVFALPNYTGSYDAVMPEVRKLKGRKIDEFCRNLEPTNNPLWKDEPLPDCNPSRVIDWCLITATPLQLSRALLATLTGG